MAGTEEKRRITRGITAAAVLAAIAVAALLVYAACDYWSAIPESVTASYVGRSRCIECHPTQSKEFAGSDHDRAMDLASTETVLADFDDVLLSRHGIDTQFRRDGERFVVKTEGPDGAMTEYDVKYVFGCQPLQQYMVELEPSDQVGCIGQVQVLRWSWDTENKKWFYLAPPDVDERLLPDDPLHWTGFGQNWNHMCAVCHSTNLEKNYDVEQRQYHTTFEEIDVSCEACHGPGSVHIQLAEANSLFWDRRRRYGLDTNLKKDQQSQIHACAPCHSRRFRASDAWVPGDNFDDHFGTQLLSPELYYPDGQILDEVYVYGSFLQSKMYEQGIRCSDCHNPHSGQVKFTDNQLCTSCHQHSEAKYDTPAHHHHNEGSAGASCVECHMPATPYMDIDFRRDHKLSVPRPDLSVKFQTPNACTGCHLDQSGLPPERSESLGHYSNWLAESRAGDEEVAASLRRADAWAATKIEQWFGAKDRDQETTAAFYLAWKHAPDAASKVFAVADDRKQPAIIRASAVALLAQYRSDDAEQIAARALRDRAALVRAAAAEYFAGANVRDRVGKLVPLLSDPVRLVRNAAVDALAAVPRPMLSSAASKFTTALEQRRAALLVDNDQVASHLGLALLAEQQQDVNRAIKHYLQAIHVQPSVVGPRTNLAVLYDRLNRPEDAQRMRLEELPLLQRDAQLVPTNDGIQYRLGLYYYTLGQLDKVEAPILRAHQLNSRNTDYIMFLTLFYEQQQRWAEAVEMASKLVLEDPQNPTFQQVYQSINAKAAAAQ